MNNIWLGRKKKWNGCNITIINRSEKPAAAKRDTAVFRGIDSRPQRHGAARFRVRAASLSGPIALLWDDRQNNTRKNK